MAQVTLNINVFEETCESFLLRSFNINRRAAINCFGMELNKLARREVNLSAF